MASRSFSSVIALDSPLAQTLHALRKAAPKRTQILYRCEGEQDGGKVVVKDNIS